MEYLGCLGWQVMSHVHQYVSELSSDTEISKESVILIEPSNQKVLAFVSLCTLVMRSYRQRRMHLYPMRRNIQYHKHQEGNPVDGKRKCSVFGGKIPRQNEKQACRGATVRHHIKDSAEAAALIQASRGPAISKVTGKI